MLHLQSFKPIDNFYLLPPLCYRIFIIIYTTRIIENLVGFKPTTRDVILKLVVLRGIEPRSFGYRPTALPLSYKTVGGKVKEVLTLIFLLCKTLSLVPNIKLVLPVRVELTVGVILPIKSRVLSAI